MLSKLKNAGALVGGILALTSLSARGSDLFVVKDTEATRLIDALHGVGANSNVHIKAGTGALHVSRLHCGRAQAGSRECRFIDHHAAGDPQEKKNTNAATSTALIEVLLDLKVLMPPVLTADVDDIDCHWKYSGLTPNSYRCDITTRPVHAAPTAQEPVADLECDNSHTRLKIYGSTKNGESGSARLHSDQPPSQGGSGTFDGEYPIVRSQGPTFHRHRRSGSYILFSSAQKNAAGNPLFALSLTFNLEGRRDNEFIIAHDPAKLDSTRFVSYGGVTCRPALPAPRLEP